MARTTRRQTFNVSTSSNNYSRPQFFNQVEFKGLCTNQNDVTIDPQSFSDARNMLVDENGVLTSRPPIKFADGESNIIDERQFGLYKIRLYRLHEEYDGVSYFVFLLRCVSHNTTEGDDKFSQYSWWIPTNLIDDKEMPKISYAHIEDKVFIWFAGIDFIALNTIGLMMNGEKYLYFEDATKYLYTPVHKLVSDGIESELEHKNLFNANYYKRYLYSSVSNIDFPSLRDLSVRVSLNKKDVAGEKYLYDTVIHDYQNETLLYPQVFVGENTYVDIVRTDRTDVILCYERDIQQIKISFGGRSFRTVLHDFEVIGNPLLTRDGLWLVAFTINGLQKCKLVAQESNDFTDLSAVFSWEFEPYFVSLATGETYAEGYAPIGEFKTIDEYAYVIPTKTSTSDPYYLLRLRWSDGANGYAENSGYLFGTKELSLCTRTLYKIQHRKSLSQTYLNVPFIPVIVTSDHMDNGFGGLLELPSITAVAHKSDGHGNYSGFTVIGEHSVSDSQMSSSDFNIYLTGSDMKVLLVYNNDLISGLDAIQRYWFSFTQSKPSFVKFDDVIQTERHSEHFKTLSDVPGYMTESYINKDGYEIDLPINNGIPILGDSGENWYLINGELWTTKITENVELILDTLITNNNVIVPPDHHATMNTNYFAYETPNGEYLLEATETRRDNGTLLLYAPSINEQKFTGKITALHPLSDSQIGIFTDDGIWYISMIQNDDGLILYSQPIRSKLPVKLRDGDEVVTALDGQALIFPTTRGIVALAPQDFIATTEKTISYITDVMQEKYRRFYDDEVMNASLYYNKSFGDVPFDGMHRPEIKICAYNYWLLFYKYLDTEILALDTRSGSWWSWSVQYPIRSITADEQLHLLLQIDYNPKSVSQSLGGVSFASTKQNVPYNDDIVANTLTGKYSIVHDNDYMGDTFVLHFASSDINWYFTSQRLGFGQINNYKAIRAINMNLRGDDVNATLYTKAYRDTYHPEQDDVVEIKINELRTFVKRFNLIHILDFQYRIENDAAAEVQHQFQLNSLSLKYEVKEGVR